MRKYDGKQEVTVSFKLTPSTWFVLIQSMLVHYKITGILGMSWLYAFAPTLGLAAGISGWLLAGFVAHLWHTYHRPHR